MGRNTPSLRMEIENIVEELRKAEKLLKVEDEQIVEDMIRKARTHIPEGSITSLDPHFLFLFFILFELNKEKK
ncbi:MAG: hypothetical protein QXO03_01055 [Thermoplasmatales archaeon]